MAYRRKKFREAKAGVASKGAEMRRGGRSRGRKREGYSPIKPIMGSGERQDLPSLAKMVFVHIKLFQRTLPRTGYSGNNSQRHDKPLSSLIVDS